MSEIFDNINIRTAKIFGYWSLVRKDKGSGVCISAAMADEFSLPRGMMSERTLAEFIMCSVGGVNGVGIRYAEDILFKKANGEYIAVSYAPITESSNGYIHEMRHRHSKKHPPLSELPNFAMISANVKKRAGDVFCVMHMTPYIALDASSDYRCIAEFFDNLRKKLDRPSVFWLGDRDYFVAVKENELDAFDEICRGETSVDRQKINFSVEMAVIPPEHTKKDALEKLAFCVRKIKKGIKGEKYEFSDSDFEIYQKSRRNADSIAKRMSYDKLALAYQPYANVKSGYVKYFAVIPDDPELARDCILNGCENKLDEAIIDKLTKLLASGEIPKAPYCIALCGKEIDLEKIKYAASLLAGADRQLFVEISARAARIDRSLAEKVELIKSAGAVPVIYDQSMKDFEICALQRMGFSVIKTDLDSPAIKACADFCRTYNLDCAVAGVDTDEDFIKMRRLGVDVCSGVAVGSKTSDPTAVIYPQPHILCDEEPEEEKEVEDEKEFDLTRFTVEKLYGRFGAPINELISPKPTELMESMDAMEKREPLKEKLRRNLEPCEFEEGIGVGKKRKKARSVRAQKKRQKKEIKKGRLKKVKLMKPEKK